jgi:hydroxylamine dehydrogenase
MRKSFVLILSIVFLIIIPVIAMAQSCVECHQTVTPNIVLDWQNSKHSLQFVGCAECHGNKHKGAGDVANVQTPTPDVCKACHEDRVKQYSKGKHALAWSAMWAAPTMHNQPMMITEGMKGCGGCHKIGLKTETEIKKLKGEGSGFGLASCDACHTRHTFSTVEAKQPQACQTCHMGFDHPQWEMYSSSKHGVRYLLKQMGALPFETIAPTCQTCHMQEGNHEVRTAWGFLALRLPLPEDKQWADDRITILQALGVLDPDGKPTARLDAIKAADMVRLTQDAFDVERNKMLSTCNKCHSGNFAKLQLDFGDKMIKEADRVMAEAIRTVADLYKDGIIEKPKEYTYAFPDLLTFHDAQTSIELKLFNMFLEFRMRTFQGTFHANPDYTNWYGWSELVKTNTEIKEMAKDLRLKEKK